MQSGVLGRRVIRGFRLDELLGNYKSFGRKSAEHINQEFLRWVSHKKDRRPFFAFLNYNDAHDPYLSPGEFQGRFSKKLPWGHMGDFQKLDALSAEEIRELKDAYDGAIAYVDHHIGQLHIELRNRGLLENTVVIIAADHGEQFGEHNLLSHTSSLYLPLLHVPLLISFPSYVPSYSRIQTKVSLRDVPATILDILGMSDAFMFPGRSLARYWNADAGSASVDEEPLLAETERLWPGSFPAWYPAMRGPMKSVLFQNMHYIRNLGTDREELYNLKDDPLEEHDLAITGEGWQVLDSFRKYLKMVTARV
jgi:arylsulfatase A-like enzyme